MNILVDIAHPAHVHLFKHFIKIMQSKGNEVIIAARNKDITFELLNTYKIKYYVLGRHYKSLVGKAFGAFSHLAKMIYLGLKYKIDIYLDAGTMYPAIVSFVLRKPNIMVDNTDVDFTLNIAIFFTNVIITPVSFKKDFGRKHIRCESFNELAFLHKKYFRPDPSILKALSINAGEKYVLLRFVLWKSIDDIGYSGFSQDEIREIVKKFSSFGRVFISCEYELPPDLRELQIEFNPKIKFGDMQNIEYYAHIYFGESGAMATECAMLGTPSYFISPKKLGFTDELEKKYDLICQYENKYGALDQVYKQIQNPELKLNWQKKRDNMLSEKISYTDFIVWFVENYPSSFDEIKKNKSIQNNFK
ncbi:MAG: DUF354 domain-containing protein [Ignavibacteriaceae bacterium]